MRESSTTRRRELKVLRTIAPQATSEDLERIRRDYALGAGAAPVDIAPSKVVSITSHDHTAQAVRREERSGRAELPPIPSQPKPARQLVWFEGQAAAG